MKIEQFNDQKIQNSRKNKNIWSSLRQNNNTLLNLQNENEYNEISLHSDEMVFPPSNIFKNIKKKENQAQLIFQHDGKIFKIDDKSIQFRGK